MTVTAAPHLDRPVQAAGPLRRAARLLLPGLLLVVPSTVAAAPASAADGSVRSAHSGRCLDADLNRIGANGTPVHLWDCNGSAQQRWIASPDGSVRSGRSGRCLDADLNTIARNGTRVQLWDCNGSPQQRWSAAPDGSIRSAHGGKCLDADLNTMGRNGTRVQLWDCNGSSQQRFSSSSAWASPKAEQAVRWFEARLGSRAYEGLCEKAVENAFGTTGRYLSARANHDARVARGQLRRGGTPPRGALVFWNTSRHGHVALSLGDGHVLTTSHQGKIGRAPLGYFGTPLGWSLSPW